MTQNCVPLRGALGVVREAGGVATTRDGAPMDIMTSQFVAGGPAVHADFMARYAKTQGGQM